MKPIRNAVRLTVDGREVVASEGTMLVDAAQQGDVEIPVFCYEPKLGGPVGACRMCLVEIEGMPKLQTACSTPVRDGMAVYTRTDNVKEAQNAVVEFLLVNHPLDCPVCDKGGECPLQDIAMGWGPGRSRMSDPKRHFQKPLELSPLVAIDRERCILCYRCVRFSQEVSEDEQLQLLERGDRTFVGTFDDRPYVAPFHGNITELCPVGALTNYTYRFRARPWDIEDAGSLCTLCPSQCNVSFTVRDERVLRVSARDNPDVDDGWLCDKGRYGFQMIGSEDRITEPMVRKGGTLVAAGWDEALRATAKGLSGAGRKTAALVGGGTSNDEGWLIQHLVRNALGSPHIACGPTEPLGREPALALAQPALAARMADIDFADAVLVLGTDPLHEASILDLRIRKAVRQAGTTLAVGSDRPTALDGGAAASARYAPGEAAAFLAALAGALGARDYPKRVPYSEEAASLAAEIRGKADLVIVWGERLLGGTDGAAAAAALLAIASKVGLARRQEAGLLEVPELSNGRGLREVGCWAGAGPGYKRVKAGKSAPDVKTSLRRGSLDALVLFEVDPIREHPGGEGWREALGAADFVLAVSMFENESTAAADVVLPAESQAEKEGTVTHPDGRLQRLRPSIAHPGSARMGWQWLVELSAQLGEELEINTGPMVLDRITKEVPFYAGLTHEEIGGTGIRWQDRPQASRFPSAGGRPAGARPGDAKRSAKTDRVKALAPGSAAPGRAPEAAPTLTIATYRDIWASEVTDRNPALEFLAPNQRLEVSVDDAKRLALDHGQAVTVSVNGSSVEARVAIRERMRPGAGFLIEGTREASANLLNGGGPVQAEVRPA